MTDNVVKFPGSTLLDIEVSEMLSSISKTFDYESAVVVAVDKKDGQFKLHSSTADIAETLLHLEVGKSTIMELLLGDNDD